MTSVYLNIGSNKGDRRANIERAVALISLDNVLGQALIRRSPWVESTAWGYASDADYINQGVALDFEGDTLPCPPLEILDRTQAIERTIAPDSPHRNADGSYCDRIVDIDIIAADGVEMDTPRLTLPHPRAEARAFVMQPMAFLAPGWHPGGTRSRSDTFSKKSIADMHRDSIAAFKTKKKIPVAVVLDNIRSLNNVGSIFRTADGFRIDRIVLCGITAAPPSPEIHKTALGAEESVDWTYRASTLEAVKELKADGHTIVCLEQVHDSVSLDAFAPRAGNRYAIIVGNEVSGVDQAVVDNSDICLEIPQEGTKHSLNVAVSAALAMWTFFAALR